MMCTGGSTAAAARVPQVAHDHLRQQPGDAGRALSTQDGKGIEVQSPTLPPQAWKLMTAWTLRPWSCASWNSWR